MKRTFGFVAGALLLGAVGALSAHAQPTPFPGRGLGLKDRTCVFGCRSTAALCRTAARTQLELCATSTCSDEIGAARQACGDDATSTDCENARQAVRTCLRPCRDTFRQSQAACRSDVVSCASECPNASPPPSPSPGSKDPACVSGCARGLAGCSRLARKDAQTCREDCVPLVTAARAACQAEPFGSDCRAARQAVLECFGQCDPGLRQGIANCLSDAATCVSECPEPSPSPSPSAGE
jgi:hypothetical protein